MRFQNLTDPFERVVPESIGAEPDGERAAAIDLDTGRFPMVLATDGEASDGHVLSIKGATVPRDTCPLLCGHQLDPTMVLGSIGDFDKREHALAAVGRMNLSDDGTWLSETRKGLATLVASRDLRAVSVRWEAIKARRRIELPEGHPAKVSEADEGPKRWGYFFEKWRVLEGSLVALGADPAALIGRAESTTDPVARAFMRSAARVLEVGASSSEAMAQAAAAFGRLHSAAEAVRALGCTDADVVNALASMANAAPAELVRYTFGESAIYLPRAAWDALLGESLEAFRASARLHSMAQASVPGGPPATTRAPSPKPGAVPGAPKSAGDTNARSAAMVADLTASELGELLAKSLESASREVARAVTGRRH